MTSAPGIPVRLAAVTVIVLVIVRVMVVVEVLVEVEDLLLS
jgi:hypothetical protein